MSEIRWSSEQAAAITEDRHALLVANAGTGKTATVIGKVRWLLGLEIEDVREGEAGEPGGAREAGKADETGRAGQDLSGFQLPPCSNPCELREIAAITFTEKAAYDLKRKLREAIMASERADELRWQIDRASIGTIHSFCGELLREHALRLRIDPTFRVIDEREAWTEQDDVIHGVVMDALANHDEGATLLMHDFQRLRGSGYAKGVIEHVRGAMRDLRWHEARYAQWMEGGERERVHEIAADSDLQEVEPDLDVGILQRLAQLDGTWDDELDGASARHVQALVSLARRALVQWTRYLDDENAKDFDALILDARRLLTSGTGAAALAGIRRRYRIVIIDEFQDTDDAQCDIAFAIAGLPISGSGASATPAVAPPADSSFQRIPATRPQLFLVGDPKQSIYRFRGADISVWNQVEQVLHEHGVVRSLSENFRCARPIVAFVNDALSAAMDDTGEELAAELPGSRIPYQTLVAGVPDSETAGLEWLVAETRNETRAGKVTIKEDKAGEATQVAARIREMVGAVHAGGAGGAQRAEGAEETESIGGPGGPGASRVTDPDDGTVRPIAYRDIAILYRSRSVLTEFERALSHAGIPYYIAGAPHLGKRQEILDVLNVLRLLRNPRDDYRAFGFLRSPFVALRDEVVVRIAMDRDIGGSTLLSKAQRFLEEGECGKNGKNPWFDAPEGPVVTDIERLALARALEALQHARALVHRAPLDEVITGLLDSLGYRLHLLLRGRAEEPLGNLQTFLQFTEEYRDLDSATFLEVWDRWDALDNGLPQAPLYSKDDDVVTLTTIHRAKGLEWPVVFLVGTGAQHRDMSSNTFWSDPVLGPLLCPATDSRGPRASRIWNRYQLEERAEDTRLLYVASTRARDRLVVVGPRNREKSFSHWLAAGVDGNPFFVRDDAPDIDLRDTSPRPSLQWLGDVRTGEPPLLLQNAAEPPLRFVVSATEMMTRDKDERVWQMRYRQGVQPRREFAPEASARVGEPGSPGSAGSSGSSLESGPIPATVRGTIIHEVLERIHAEEELSRLLQETIGGLDDPDLELLLSDSEYREMLETEIRRVIQSDEWTWYAEGEHYRELQFLHLAEPRSWRVGAFDLYRPEEPAWVIDFKTHEIGAEQARETARGYEIQARIYRAASAIRSPARVALHFTGPNELIEMSEGEPGR